MLILTELKIIILTVILLLSISSGFYLGYKFESHKLTVANTQLEVTQTAFNTFKSQSNAAAIESHTILSDYNATIDKLNVKLNSTNSSNIKESNEIAIKYNNAVNSTNPTSLYSSSVANSTNASSSSTGVANTTILSGANATSSSFGLQSHSSPICIDGEKISEHSELIVEQLNDLIDLLNEEGVEIQ